MTTEKKKIAQILLVTWSDGRKICYSGISHFCKRFPHIAKRATLYNYLQNKKLPYYHAECTIERVLFYRPKD